MSTDMIPNDRLRFISPQGEYNWAAMMAAVEARIATIKRDAALSYRADVAEQIAAWSESTFRRIAKQEVQAEADGEMSIFDMRARRNLVEISRASPWIIGIGEQHGWGEGC